MTQKKHLEKYIHQSVPLTKAMGFKVTDWGRQGIALKVPLKPNVNHVGTVFGGTLVGAQAVACWAWLSWTLGAHGMRPTIVIKSCKHDFLKGVAGDFVVRCKGMPQSKMRQLIKTLKSKGRARLDLSASIKNGKAELCQFKGRYVLILK